ncbi:MAG: Ubiquinone biosynthesis O-methyltransferase [Ignavibacteriaceae bacterium]|nr:Ubiquinone biosynthesis O-methyltransferase [Ignavibacteriaceae bacterium]
MTNSDNSLSFTGEYFIPGKSGERIEADHLERYKFACNFAKDKSILDIACGVGYAGPMFIQAGAKNYFGADINDKLIKYAKDNYASEQIGYSISDICTFRFERKFDLISCFETIEHIKNYKAAIINLYNLLDSGGTLLISSPNRPVTSPNCNSLNDKPSNEFHIQEFIPEELLLLLNENGFSTDKNNLYGQRQRKKVYRNRYIRKIIYTLFGNPDIKTSSVVAPVKELLPRYFVIVALKR